MFDENGTEAYLNSHAIGEIPTNLPFEVFEKMDGSLGIMFWYVYDGKGEWVFASRGSFTSEQAVVGKDMLHWMYQSDPYLYSNMDRDWTHIFEIIYPDNRIVVDYGDAKKLVLLGAINTFTGTEISYDELTARYFKNFFIVKRYDGIEDFTLLKGMEEDNKEGFVVRFSNGFRMKVKFEEYCRLHAIVTNVSNKIIWKHLMNDESFEDLLDRVPDEFYNWVLKTKKDLEDAYKEIELECYKKFVECLRDTPSMADPITRKKAFALKAKDYKYSGILFSIYDGKDHSESIWRLVRPIYSPAFKEVVEE